MDPSKKDDDHDSHFDGFTPEEIEKNFKNLANELQAEKGKNISELSQDLDIEEDIKVPYFQNYSPKVDDYLARAKTEEECLEIIKFCLEKKEITEKQANHLRDRLKKGGPRAFGTRNWGYYTSQN